VGFGLSIEPHFVLVHTKDIWTRFRNSLEKSVSEPIIHVENVHKSFLMGKEAVQALRGVDLDVMPGDMVCLMGPSGSGKTTLLNILGGLEEPSRGHVIVDGQNVVALSEDELARLRLRTMGFVFQNYNLLANFTALENVESPMALAGLRGRKRRQKATDLLQLVGLGDRADHYPTELSGGQQQRVAIARALANDPAILIGDEITGDLDSVTGFEVMRLVTQLNYERGTTVIYVTHDPRMAEYARRLIQIRDGRLVSDEITHGLSAGTEMLAHEQKPADGPTSADEHASVEGQASSPS
jgi:putative ABC transport system ATP-binding protein